MNINDVSASRSTSPVARRVKSEVLYPTAQENGGFVRLENGQPCMLVKVAEASGDG